MIDYEGIAKAILKNDWDINEYTQYGKYSIIQFQGTAFDSDYKCYKVLWSEWINEDGLKLAQKTTYKMVAKVTNTTETVVLKSFKNKEDIVPNVYATIHFNSEVKVIFEEFLEGDELYAFADYTAWVNTAIKLAEFHKKMWETNEEQLTLLKVSEDFSDRLKCAQIHTVHNLNWKEYVGKAVNRMIDAPKTLIHGDLFPTNVIVNDNKIKIIDWADASVFSYMSDIARLTAIIDIKTLLPMCPCVDEAINAYYQEIKSVLQIDYKEYLQDVYYAQFLELAHIYIPPGNYIPNQEYNRKVEERMNEIIKLSGELLI